MADDEDTPPNITYLNVDKPPRPKRPAGKRARDEERIKKEIPVLPAMEIEVSDLKVTSGLTKRDQTCVNLRLMGAPFVEIAKLCEYSSAAEAKRRFYSALAATHSPEDWETMRQLETMRAEQLMRRSFAMAAADYLVDADTGEKIPNTERLRWHDQAGRDLALHAMISGAKAPARLEVTPTENQYQEIVDKILAAEGFQPAIEAEIIDVEVIPDGPDERE